jgi:large subunit ribosomal protein L4
MRVPVYNMKGNQVGETDLRDDIFAATVNEAVMHQALVRQLANARLGTHKTKTRGEVRGGGRKPWRQKGTGRARQGSIRAPHWKGGGTVFGPTPRSYEQKMPRKMRRQALRSALSVKAASSQVRVLDLLEMSAPRTKDVVAMLKNLGIDGSSALILVPQRDEVVLNSVRNLPDVRTLVAQYLNVRDLLKFDYILVPMASLEVIESILATDVETPQDQVEYADGDVMVAGEVGEAA